MSLPHAASALPSGAPRQAHGETSVRGERPKLVIDMRMVRNSGIGTYLRQVVPRVLNRRSFATTLLGDEGELNALGLAEFANIRPSLAPIYSVREQLALRAAVTDDPDLFWSPHYNIPLAGHQTLVATVHDALHLAHPEHVRGAHRRAYARFMFRQLRKRAAAVICDSSFTAGELTRLVGIESGKLHVIHLGVSESWFDPIETAPPHPRPYFIYVGNVKPHKNLRRLLAAFDSVVADLPHDLLVVGRAEGLITADRDALRYRSADGRVRFLGEVAEDRLRALVANAEALVIPSLYEGFGLPALEAMAANCPVLASRSASLPEVCGDAAMYFDPTQVAQIAACLQRVAGDPILRAELVARGLERARGFRWESCAESTAAVLERVLD